jgi:hypothetical protein
VALATVDSLTGAMTDDEELPRSSHAGAAAFKTVTLA